MRVKYIPSVELERQHEIVPIRQERDGFREIFFSVLLYICIEFFLDSFFPCSKFLKSVFYFGVFSNTIPGSGLRSRSVQV